MLLKYCYKYRLIYYLYYLLNISIIASQYDLNKYVRILICIRTKKNTLYTIMMEAKQKLRVGNGKGSFLFINKI